jgi:hypothetical protein
MGLHIGANYCPKKLEPNMAATKKSRSRDRPASSADKVLNVDKLTTDSRTDIAAFDATKDQEKSIVTIGKWGNMIACPVEKDLSCCRTYCILKV